MEIINPWPMIRCCKTELRKVLPYRTLDDPAAIRLLLLIFYGSSGINDQRPATGEDTYQFPGV